MQMTQKMEKKVIALIMMFMIIFNNCFSLFSGLVSFAADNSDDRITYSAEFVVLNGENEQQESEEEQAETETTIFGEDIENDEESSSMLTQENNINEMNNQ